VTRYDFSTLSQQEQELAIASTATKLQASFNLSESPLVQAAIFDRGANQPSYLLLIIHHLAVDGVSWRILLEDFKLFTPNYKRVKQLNYQLKQRPSSSGRKS
jgi:NRPS condensation-like uncharacterized protein